MQKHLLDDLIKIQKLDPQNMIHLVTSMPRQCRDARKQALLKKWPVDSSTIGSMVVCGMGGSAMSGDLISNYLRSSLRIPMVVIRDYDLPAWVQSNTLVVCSSYSGDTEETLSIFRQAVARKMKIVVMTSGGSLLREARKNKLPYFEMPKGVPPRVMVPYSLITLLTLLETLQLLPSMTREMEEAISGLEESSSQYKLSNPTRSNLAKQLAEFCDKTIPVIYAGESAFQAVAYRWKCQFNENAKQMVHVNSIPEMNHNEILAYTTKDLFVKKASVLTLRSKKYDHPRVQKRFDILQKMVLLKTKNVKEIWMEGSSLLSQTLKAVYLGDFVSVYLAFLRGINPTPIGLIDRLKNDLRK